MVEQHMAYLAELRELLKVCDGLPEVQGYIFARIRRVLDAIERGLELGENETSKPPGPKKPPGELR